MPLVDCPECGNEVSKSADECPKCGYPLKKKRKQKQKLWTWFIGGLLVIALLYSYGNENDNNTRANSNSNSESIERRFSTTALNIRNGPSINSKKVGVYHPGEKFNVYGKKNEWIKTNKGWVAKKYTKKYTTSNYNNWSSSNSTKENSDSNYTQSNIAAWTAMQEFVKRKLKAPATAEFPWYSNNNVSVMYMGDRKYIVSGFVDAENSFGAKVRITFDGTIKDNGQSWSLISLQLDE